MKLYGLAGAVYVLLIFVGILLAIIFLFTGFWNWLGQDFGWPILTPGQVSKMLVLLAIVFYTYSLYCRLFIGKRR